MKANRDIMSLCLNRPSGRMMDRHSVHKNNALSYSENMLSYYSLCDA